MKNTRMIRYSCSVESIFVSGVSSFQRLNTHENGEFHY